MIIVEYLTRILRKSHGSKETIAALLVAARHTIAIVVAPLPLTTAATLTVACRTSSPLDAGAPHLCGLWVVALLPCTGHDSRVSAAPHPRVLPPLLTQLPMRGMQKGDGRGGGRRDG